jgi:hypothetical protein
VSHAAAGLFSVRSGGATRLRVMNGTSYRLACFPVHVAPTISVVLLHGSRESIYLLPFRGYVRFRRHASASILNRVPMAEYTLCRYILTASRPAALASRHAFLPVALSYLSEPSPTSCAPYMPIVSRDAASRAESVHPSLVLDDRSGCIPFCLSHAIFCQTAPAHGAGSLSDWPAAT